LNLSCNRIEKIPKALCECKKLVALNLDTNEIQKLPKDMDVDMMPNLRNLNMNGNPIVWPPKEIMVLETSSILKFINSEKVKQSL